MLMKQSCVSLCADMLTEWPQSFYWAIMAPLSWLCSVRRFPLLHCFINLLHSSSPLVSPPPPRLSAVLVRKTNQSNCVQIIYQFILNISSNLIKHIITAVIISQRSAARSCWILFPLRDVFHSDTLNAQICSLFNRTTNCNQWNVWREICLQNATNRFNMIHQCKLIFIMCALVCV